MGVRLLGILGSAETVFRRCWRIPNRRGIGGHRRSSGPSLIRMLRKSIVGWQKIRPARASSAIQPSGYLNGCAINCLNADMMADTRLSKTHVRAQKRGSRVMFVPLSHPPGHGQAPLAKRCLCDRLFWVQKAYSFLCTRLIELFPRLS